MATKPKPSETLTVAVTGPTGTFGFGLVPLLQLEERVARVIGIARRPFDPGERMWTKMEYRQGDVRDPDALLDAFRGADVVVHLAFMITGTAPRATVRAINVDGTLNAFRAAAKAGAKRFVYASSVAAYGFHADNPVGMTEEWPVRPAAHLFYAQEKAEIEELLAQESAEHPDIDLYLLRPPIVVGPDAMGAKDIVPGPLAPLISAVAGLIERSPFPLPVAAPSIELQFIHQDDVGQALLACIVADGPPGAYNIAGDGVVSGPEIARELGFTAVPLPGRPVRAAARALAAIPTPGFVPPAAEWIEAASHPAIMDITKAKAELGFAPQYTGMEALRDTLGRAGDGDEG